MNTSFKLILEIATPMVLDTIPTLDAVLSAAVYHKTGLIRKDTIPEIPLAREHGIFRGSCMVLPRNYRHRLVSRVMNLRGEADLDPGRFQTGTRSGFRVDRQRGPYKANLDAYQAYEASEVYFYGHGDPEKAQDLIATYLPGLGRRVNAGAGQVVNVRWLATAEDYSWRRRDGSPARYLPVDLWRSLGGRKTAPAAQLAVDLPYWETTPVPAVFPESLIEEREAA